MNLERLAVSQDPARIGPVKIMTEDDHRLLHGMVAYGKRDMGASRVVGESVGHGDIEGDFISQGAGVVGVDEESCAFTDVCFRWC